MGALDVRNTEQLLAAARAGDAVAFGELTERFRGYVQAVARGMVPPGSPVPYSSIVQTAIAAAWIHFGQFRGHTAAELLRWFRRIVINRAQNRLDQARRRQAVRLDSEIEGEIPCRGPDPHEQVALLEDIERLTTALSHYPETDQMLITLRYELGLSWPEVAGRMKLTEQAVRQRAHRLLLKLKTDLGNLS
jgi:RNA polymerase sigma-70 factor (ECF subfamily)